MDDKYLDLQQTDDQANTDKTETDKAFPEDWLLALDFAVYACKKLGITPQDTPKEAIEILRVLLL